MGKIIFFDIDGTLVGFKGDILDSTREALQAAKRNGHKILLCTGRSKNQIYPWLLEEGFQGIVAAAGAYVECDGKVIYHHTMKKEDVQKAVANLRKWQAPYGFQSATGTIVHADQKDAMQRVFTDMGIDIEKIEQIFSGLLVENGEDFYDRVEKMMYYHCPKTVSEVQKVLAPDMDVTVTSFEEPDECSGEITTAGVNKATGMQKAVEYFGLIREDTVAFGDGPNDMEMLQYAKIGVAMGNAVLELKQHAYMVTDDIGHEGVAHAMLKLGLI